MRKKGLTPHTTSHKEMNVWNQETYSDLISFRSFILRALKNKVKFYQTKKQIGELYRSSLTREKFIILVTNVSNVNRTLTALLFLSVN